MQSIIQVVDLRAKWFNVVVIMYIRKISFESRKGLDSFLDS